MEQGFSDVCVALCMGQTPVARVAQTCRSAALEMPRPTVRKWCEHGYTVAYDKSMKALVQRFVEINAENEKKTAEQHTKDFLKRQKEKDMADAAAKKQAAADAAAGVVPPPVVVTEAEVPKKIVATLPITLNEDETYELNVVEGQNVEDAVVVFCREHVSSDVAACIRQLLPDVLERYSEHTEGGGLRGN
jgi:hypothetical protein